MVFGISILMYGLLTASSVNALYPTYAYSADYSSHSITNGFSYVDVDGVLWLSKLDYTANATVYFNKPTLDINTGDFVYDYKISDVNIDLTFTYYYVDGEDYYIQHQTDANISLDLSTLNDVTSQNIDNDGIYRLEVSLSDVADYTLISNLYPNHHAVISGGFYIPEEAMTYFTFGFNFVFAGGFKDQLQDYIITASDNSYNQGYNDGYSNAYNTGYDEGATYGYQTGYTEGYNQGATQDETAVAIFSGIISVGLIPINFFLACLNFEVFGINIGAFVSALLTIAIVVIVTRMIVSGGNGGNNG